VAQLPLIGKPVSQLAGLSLGQIHQQLREVELWIDIMAATGAGETGQDGSSAATAGIANEQGILPVMEIFP